MLSLGIGLTNECNLNCPHCYRPTNRIYRLSPEDIRRVCDRLPVASVGLGTGENVLHPQFSEIIELFHSRGVKLTMASNGFGINNMPAEYLEMFHDLEVSIDFPTEGEQDRFRGDGNWREVMGALERCRRHGVEATVLATMMNANFDKLDRLAILARSLGANLRVNVYQPVATGAFSLSYDQFWEGYRRLFDSAMLVSCSEPVVCAVLGDSPAVSPCGRKSVRITPQGRVAPCVYWPGSSLTIADLYRLGEDILESEQFHYARQVPLSAADCPCRGGCAGRRALAGCFDAHDLFCPWVRGDDIKLTATLAPRHDLPRASNVCTTIVR